jgi:hypothetical protein
LKGILKDFVKNAHKSSVTNNPREVAVKKMKDKMKENKNLGSIDLQSSIIPQLKGLWGVIANTLEADLGYTQDLHPGLISQVFMEIIPYCIYYYIFLIVVSESRPQPNQSEYTKMLSGKGCDGLFKAKWMELLQVVEDNKTLTIEFQLHAQFDKETGAVSKDITIGSHGLQKYLKCFFRKKESLNLKKSKAADTDKREKSVKFVTGSNTTQPSTCYNCKKTGHVAKDCSQPCHHCVEANIDVNDPEVYSPHVSSNCWNRPTDGAGTDRGGYQNRGFRGGSRGRGNYRGGGNRGGNFRGGPYRGNWRGNSNPRGGYRGRGGSSSLYRPVPKTPTESSAKT